MVDFLLSDSDNRQRTAAGNATAADIVSGKTAWVNNALITGTGVAKPLPIQNGIRVWMQNPLNIADASYQPHADHGGLLIKDTAIALSSAAGWTLDRFGNAFHPSAYQLYAYAPSLPALTTRRKFEVWGSVRDDGALVNYLGTRIIINIVDDSNFWWFTFEWYNTGGYFQIAMMRRTAGVDTNLGSATFSTAVDFPVNYHMIVTEQGDAVLFQVGIYEVDSVADDESRSVAYTVASRPHKTATQFYVGDGLGGGNNFRIGGFRMSDML